MNIEAINALQRRAQTIGFNLLRHLPGSGRAQWSDWRDYNGEQLEWDLVEADKIRFTWNRYAFIEFEGISPAKVVREKVHDPVTIGKKIEDAQSTTIRNDSSVEQTRIYAIEVGETRTFNEEVGVSISVGFQYQFSLGGENFAKHQLTFNTSIETSYNKSWGGEDNQSRKTETEVTIPPHKTVTVTTARAKSKLEQKMEVWCDLEHSIRVFSDRDWDYTFDSCDDYRLMLQGLLPSDQDGHHLYKKGWHKDGLHKPRSKEDAYERLPELELHYEHKIKFDRAVTGDVNITERDL